MIKYCKCIHPLVAEGDKPTFHKCYRCNRITTKKQRKLFEERSTYRIRRFIMSLKNPWKIRMNYCITCKWKCNNPLMFGDYCWIFILSLDKAWEKCRGISYQNKE
jgi:hypothetical protein